MMLLELGAFKTGAIDAAPAGSFIKSFEDSETQLFVFETVGLLWAVALSGSHAWSAAPAVEMTGWSGIIIPDARIVVDLNSAQIDTHPKLGDIVWAGQRGTIKVKRESNGMRHFGDLSISGGEEIDKNVSSLTVFNQWSIVTGRGEDQQSLFERIPANGSPP